MTSRAAPGILLLALIVTACDDPAGPALLPAGCTEVVNLDRDVGDIVRLKGPADAEYPCLLFEPERAGNGEFLLLFENMAPTGGFSLALFPGTLGDTLFPYSISFDHDVDAPVVVTRSHTVASVHPPDDAGDYSWDFGAGRLREHHAVLPPHVMAVPDAQLLKSNTAFNLRSAAIAEPAVGDTITVRMEALPYLEIPAGFQKAVIRYVAPALIIAEDVRLPTLERHDGGYNTPIAEADLAAIAAEYSAVARIQGDLLFNGRFNNAVENIAPNRVIAVHSLMPEPDVWGYTYGVTNYFVWDYWVATDGVTKSINQHAQRVADNLFMHETTHMRHAGLLERNNRLWTDAERGNRWLVEGFARFAERLPIAARLLGTVNPSRTDNIVLPRNPAFNNAYFLDDVPTYLHASSSSWFGYHTSAYVFDYFADQVALSGGDWKSALRAFLLSAKSRTMLDATVSAWVSGLTFSDLYTRSRIALYADDDPDRPGLPAWTQYQQYQLRASRPAPEQQQAQDPRNLWAATPLPAQTAISGSVPSGGARGHVIVTSSTDPATVLRITGPAGPNAILTLTRIR